MSLLLSLVLSASPQACSEVFPNVWSAWQKREELREERPRFEKVPDARDRVEKEWVKACASLDAAALDCARGLTFQKQVDAMFERVKGNRLATQETEHAVNKLKKTYTVLECPAVEPAMSQAVDAVVPPPRPASKVEETPPPKPAKAPKGQVID